MVEVGFAVPRIYLAAVGRVELGVPAAAGVVDQVGSGEVPELPVPGLVRRVPGELGQERTGPDPFGHRPPIMVGVGRRAVKLDGVAEAAVLVVPADVDGSLEQLSGRVDAPILRRLRWRPRSNRAGATTRAGARS